MHERAAPTAVRRDDRDPSTAAARRCSSGSQGRVLDPATAMTVEGVIPRPTVYVGPRLVVSGARDVDDVLAAPAGGRRASSAGTVALDPTSIRRRVPPRRPSAGASGGWPAVAPDGLGGRLAASHAPGHRGQVAGPTGARRLGAAPAGAGRRHGIRRRLLGVGLDHVLFELATTRSTSPTRSTTSNPFDSQPVQDCNPVSDPIVDVRHAGERRPAAGRLRRARAAAYPRRQRSTSRRPVVAILDTGCGTHQWLDGVVTRQDVGIDGHGHRVRRRRRPTRRSAATTSVRSTVASTRWPATARSSRASSTRPARTPTSYAWRVVDSSGPIVESDWIDALTKMVELVRAARRGRAQRDGRSTC